MAFRQILLIDQEVRSDGGRELSSPTRRVAAAAVLENPFAGRPGVQDLSELVELSVKAGEMLTARALGALGSRKPCGYGKAALVGTSGELEHGAAMIHVRLGLAMRRGARGGPALIPGNAKVGAPGTPIDVVFGGIEDAWDYDAMDTLQVSVPDAPRAHEIVLVVAFLAGGRPNARIKGASHAEVSELVRRIRSEDG
jgi:hypothetical protein